MLAEERQFYDDHLQEWLRDYPGRFVLVRGKELIGVFDTPDDALAEGARRFGLSSFLVRRVEPVQQEIKVPALTLGLLNADPPRAVRDAGASAGR